MESSTRRADAERQRQLELRRKIQALQAQLAPLSSGEDDHPHSLKRKQIEPTLLAPSTPSPRKKRRLEKPPHGRNTSPTPCSMASAKHSRESSGSAKVDHHASSALHVDTQHLALPPSNVLKKLSNLSNRSNAQSKPGYARSSNLSEIPKPLMAKEPEHEAPYETTQSVSQRDENLAIIEELRMGPTDHKAPLDDPLFEHLEPNSGIRLSSRSLSHEGLQDYLRGRYYLSPSRLYSCIRLLPNKSGYDVPVEGDWVTIAVVAERGQVRVSRAPVSIQPGDDGHASDGEVGGGAGTSQAHAKPAKKQSKPAEPHGKKYVNLKLIDFGARSISSATGGKAALRGDASLTLLLFESDRFDKITNDDGSERKVYQGGSRGAFESMSKLKEGDVIALLNSRVLKPYQRSSEDPHRTNNILAVTPESAGSIALIGRARDLGMCKVVKRDGKPCGSWTDKRVSEVCDWHLTNAVQRQRAGRAEFFAGTTGMSTSAAQKPKADYDPSRQWGLKPETRSNDSTYIISGHVVGGSTGSLFVSERLGREAQAKAQRRLEKNADRELKSLLDRDKEGMKAVTKAREFVQRAKASAETSGGKLDKGKQKAGSESVEEELCPKDSSAPIKQAYSATIIKRLGFDPAVRMGQRPDDSSLQKKIEALAAVQSSRKNINLGPRPGPKIRSGVSVPAFMLAKDDVASDPELKSDDHLPSEDESLVCLDSDI